MSFHLLEGHRRWHDRSRHESLITCSRQWIPEGRLMTFQVPEAWDRHGVRLQRVTDRVDERGNAWCHRRETDAVAGFVVDHLRAAPRPRCPMGPAQHRQPAGTMRGCGPFRIFMSLPGVAGHSRARHIRWRMLISGVGAMGGDWVAATAGSAARANGISFTVAITPSESGGFVATALGLLGCFTQGETLAQVRARIQEAIGLTLEDMAERGEQLHEVRIEHVRIKRTR